MNNIHAKDLFHLQSELIEVKVDMAVAKVIDGVIDQIRSLRNEMFSEMSSMKHEIHEQIHDLRIELSEQMNTRFTALERKTDVMESSLAQIRETQKEIRSKFVDYTFRAGWLLLAASFSYVIAHFFGLIK